MFGDKFAELISTLQNTIGDLAGNAPRGIDSIIDILFGIWISLINLIPGVQAAL